MRKHTSQWLFSLLIIMSLAFNSNAQYLTESFETWPPTDWTFKEKNDSNPWMQGAEFSSEGSKSMKYEYSSSKDADAWAITPAIGLTKGSIVKISFDYRGHKQQTEKLKLTVGNSTNIASQTKVLFSDKEINFDVFKTKTITYLIPSDGDYYFGFNCYSDADEYELYVDNIIIENGGPTCIPPSGLNVTNITSTTAILNWTAGNTETEWDVEYGPKSFTQNTGSMILVNTNSTTNITALTANTVYDFYVRASCSASDKSEWIGPYSFTTTCEGNNTLPLLEGFETGFDKFINANGCDTDFNLETTIVKEGTTSIHNTYNANCKSSIVTQCNIDLTDYDKPQLSFWHIAKTEKDKDKCHIQISVDNATFIDLPQSTYEGNSEYNDEYFDEKSYNEWGTGFEAPNNTWWKKEIFNLTDYKESSNIRIRFKLTSDGSTQRDGWFIDDIKIINTSCPSPSALNVANITTSSADLVWITGGSTTWDIEWGETGFTPSGTPKIENSTDNPYTLTGLTAETAYDFYVRDDCNSDNSNASQWVGPFTFKTIGNCAEPTNLTANIINGESAILSWKGYTATNWDIEWGVSGFTPTKKPTIENITSNPYTLSGLTELTTYDYYVRADCNSANTYTSNWVGPFSFTTICSTIENNYLETFETYMPSCWSKSKGPITGPTGIGATGWVEGGFAYNGNKGSIYNNLYGKNASDWLITPKFDLSAGGSYLMFEVAVTSAYGPEASGMGTDNEVQLLYTEDGLTWNNLDTWNTANTPSNTGEYKTYNLSAITGKNVQFAFWANEGIADDSEDCNFYIDNFEVRPINSETDILTYSFAEQTTNANIDTTNHKINIEVGKGTEPSTLVATYTLSDFATANVSGTKQESGITANNFEFGVPFTYTIIAEDKSSQDWNIIVTESTIYTETNILTFSFAEQTGDAIIDTINHTIDIEVAYGTNITNIIPAYTLSYGATINQSTTNFSSPVTYTITAEDGITTQDWVINVTIKDPNTETDFITFNFDKQTCNTTIDTKNHTIAIEIEECLNLNALTATFTLSANAKSFINNIAQVSGITVNDFRNPVIYTVIAEDETTTQDWTITVTDLSMIISTFPYFEGFEGTSMPNHWTILNEDGDSKKWGLFTDEYQEGVQSAAVGFNHNGNNDWLITPMVNINENNLLIDFQAKSFSSLESYNVLISTTGNAPADFTTVLENVIDAPKTWENKTYELSKFGITKGDSIYIAIQCVSEDKFYLIIDAFTIRPAYIETDILTFEFVNQTVSSEIDSMAHTVKVKVGTGLDLANLNPATFTLSDSAVAKVGDTEQVSGITINDFTSPVIYTVEALNGNTQNWTVRTTVSEHFNNQTDILTYHFTEQTSDAIIDTINHTVNIEVAYGTNIENIVPTYTLSHGATTTQTTTNFSSAVIYTITAEDGVTIQNWTIIVTVAPNAPTEILTYSFAEQTGAAIIDTTTHTINIEVKACTDLTSLIAKFTLLPNASAAVNNITQISGETINDFTNPVIYKVFSSDVANAQNWTIKVTALPTVVISDFPFFEGFENTTMPNCWTILDEDGDNSKWDIETHDAQEGTQSVFVKFNEFGNNDWLITPMININEDNLAIEFQAKSYNPDFLESYNVLISKTGNEPENFTTILEKVVDAPSVWKKKTYKLSDFGVSNGDNIYIAIQCVSKDESILRIDAFNIRPLNSETDILTFSFTEQTEDAIIDPTNQTIDIEVAYGTNITNITPTYTLSYGATIDQSITDFSSPVTYSVTAENGITTKDWTVTVSVAVGINDIIKANQVIIYPNPNNGQFNIALDLSTSVNIKIVNILGEIVSAFENVKAKETITINLGNKKSGLYFARISSKNNTIIKKVNIIR